MTLRRAEFGLRPDHKKEGFVDIDMQTMCLSKAILFFKDAFWWEKA